MNPYAAFWGAWALLGIAVEAAALHGRRRPLDTLSRNVQFLVCRPVVRQVTLAGWVGFSVWFAAHIWG